jgi:hypothetical protein
VKVSRDTLLGLALVAVLFIVTVIAAVVRPDEAVLPPLASFSNQPDGARAMKLWLEALGYDVDADGQSIFRPPRDPAVLLLLEPTEFVTDAEWERLEAAVEVGATLLIAGEQFPAGAAFDHFGFVVLPLETISGTVSAAAPLFTSPPLTQPVQAEARYWLRGTRAHAPLLAVGEQPVAVTFTVEKGRVILCSLPLAFSNAGLKQPGNAELVLNLIASAEVETVWFNEWHHGQRVSAQTAEAILGPEAWLQRTPAGHALLFCALIIFIALALRGQRFGAPVPLPRDLSRRAPLEYITALANLSRRAGHRTAALNDYTHRLKRHLGKRYRLDPTVPDGEFIARLAQYKPDLDRAALTQLLNRLRKPNASEAELIQAAGEVAEWTKE